MYTWQERDAENAGMGNAALKNAERKNIVSIEGLNERNGNDNQKVNNKQPIQVYCVACFVITADE